MFLSIILQIVNKMTFLQIFIVDYLLQIDVRTKFLQLLFLTDGQGPGWSNLIFTNFLEKFCPIRTMCWCQCSLQGTQLPLSSGFPWMSENVPGIKQCPQKQVSLCFEPSFANNLLDVLQTTSSFYRAEWEGVRLKVVLEALYSKT